MAYTTTELITRAWYLSSVVSRDFETVSGDQLNDGLQMLNALLSFKTASQILIPYFNSYQFDTEPDTEVYFVPNLVYPETLTFLNQTVRFATTKMSRKAYQGTFRAQNVQSLMMTCNFERCLGGSNVSLYYYPNAVYPVTIWGKFSLENVVLGQDLLLIYDAYYIEYLRYGLAQYICQEYNITFQPDSKATLDSFEKTLVDIGYLDLTMEKVSTFGRIRGFNYGDANLGKGWRGPG